MNVRFYIAANLGHLKLLANSAFRQMFLHLTMKVLREPDVSRQSPLC